MIPKPFALLDALARSAFRRWPCQRTIRLWRITSRINIWWSNRPRSATMPQVDVPREDVTP